MDVLSFILEQLKAFFEHFFNIPIWILDTFLLEGIRKGDPLFLAFLLIWGGVILAIMLLITIVSIRDFLKR